MNRARVPAWIRWPPALLASAVGLFLLMRFNYLMFHTVVEVFSVAVAWGMFMVAWNTRRHQEHGFFLFIGIFFLAVGAIDTFHLLTYEGMGVLTGITADLPTKLWLAARALQAGALLAAPLFLSRRAPAGRTLLLAVLAGGLLAWLPFTPVFPVAFREGQGLTAFKIGAEIGICVALIGAIVFLHRRRKLLDPAIYRLAAAASAATVVSELLFTLYHSPVGFFNFLGHLLKLLAFGLFYKAVVESSLARPVDVLFRSLSQAEARYRSLVEMSPDAVFVNREDRIAFVNPAGVRLFGGSVPEQIIGRQVLDLFSPEFHGQVRERIRKLRAGESIPLVEEKIVRLDGSSVEVEVAASKFSDSEGDGIQVILRDIHERKQAEERVRKLNLELEERVQQRTEQLTRTIHDLESFSYSISHDLRAPLRAINGFASIVLEENADCLDEYSRRRLRKVIDSGNQMGLLVDELLAFFRLSRRELTLETIDMKAMVCDVFQEVRAREAHDREVELILSALPPARGNPLLLRQVWVNLLDNALKFSRTRPRTVIEVEGRREDGEHVFVVRDNGIGFRAEYAVRIFGVFQRLHLPEEYEGNGIGLSFVKKIVERHGGRVWAEGEPDRGASFHFTLPVGE